MLASHEVPEAASCYQAGPAKEAPILLIPEVERPPAASEAGIRDRRVERSVGVFLVPPRKGRIDPANVLG